MKFYLLAFWIAAGTALFAVPELTQMEYNYLWRQVPECASIKFQNGNAVIQIQNPAAVARTKWKMLQADWRNVPISPGKTYQYSVEMYADVPGKVWLRYDFGWNGKIADYRYKEQEFAVGKTPKRFFLTVPIPAIKDAPTVENEQINLSICLREKDLSFRKLTITKVDFSEVSATPAQFPVVANSNKRTNIWQDQYEKELPRANDVKIDQLSILEGTMDPILIGCFLKGKQVLKAGLQLPKQDILWAEGMFFRFEKNTGTAEFALGNLKLTIDAEKNGRELKLFAGEKLLFHARNGQTGPIRFSLGRASAGKYYFAADGKWSAISGSPVGRDTELTDKDLDFTLNFNPTVSGMLFLKDAKVFTAPLLQQSGENVGNARLSGEKIPFRPRKEDGWEIAFADEFNGTRLDSSRWIFEKPNMYNHDVDIRFQGWVKDCMKLDGKGVLHVLCKFDPKAKLMQFGYMRSRQTFLYGYYETRFKVSRQPGWWGAVWLMDEVGHYNPLRGGFEIDMMEDFYFKVGDKNRLDFNVHTGKVFSFFRKDWRTAEVVDPDAWHVVGVRWLPEGITYYLNGKEIMHLAAETHVFANQPINALISSQPGTKERASWTGDWREGKFPDEFQVDYFRFYQKRGLLESAPQVALHTPDLGTEDGFMEPEGRTIRFSIDAKPSPVTGKKISKVYLLDNGYIIGEKSVPPYQFTVSMTPEFYQNCTRYITPGDHVGRVIKAPAGEHAFGAAAVDEDGRIGMYMGKAPYLYIRGSSRAYQGKTPNIPGFVRGPYYDEGGQTCAYLTNECGSRLNNRVKSGFRLNEYIWTDGKVVDHKPGTALQYTVNVAKSGKYLLKVHYIYPKNEPQERRIRLTLDNRQLAELMLDKPGEKWSSPENIAVSAPFELSAGKHTLTYWNYGKNYNSTGFEIVEAEK